MKCLITGFGLVTNNSNNSEALWNQLINKECNFVDYRINDDESIIVGREPSFSMSECHVSAKKMKYLDKQTQSSLYACSSCLNSAGLNGNAFLDPTRVGIISGSMFAQLEFGLEQVAKVAIENSNRISAYTGLAFYYGANVGEMSCMLGTKGENCCVATGSSIGIDGIAIAVQQMALQRNDVCFVGAGENVVYDVLYSSLKEQGKVTSNKYLPYHKDRNGAALSNGSAMLCLETEQMATNRNAKVYGEIKAVKALNAPCCFFAVDEKIVPYYERIIKSVLDEAHIAPDEIDLVIPTAEGTIENDLYEAQAIASVFDSRKNILYSPKPVVGYCTSFNTILDTIVATKCIETDTVPGFLFEMDTGTKEINDMFLPTETQARAVKNVLIVHKNWTDAKISAMVIGEYRN